MDGFMDLDDDEGPELEAWPFKRRCVFNPM